MPKIIGITGTLGAGKGTIVDFLVEHYNYKHWSVRYLLTKLLEERGLEVNRDNMAELANELRAQHNPAYLVELLYERAKASGQHCIIESIRTTGEVALLRKKENFLLLGIDADSAIRYKRISYRNSSTDQVSYEKFLSDEERELNNQDPHKQNLLACLELADIVIRNNSTIGALRHELEGMEMLQPDG